MGALRQLLASHGIGSGTVQRIVEIAERGEMLELDNVSDRVRFVHHKFQEYFAAQNLNTMLAERRIDYSDLPAICRNIWWNEVVGILAGTAKEPSRIIDTLLADYGAEHDEMSLVLPLSNLWLAGRCVQVIPEKDGEREKKTEVVVKRMRRVLGDKLAPTYQRFDAMRAISELDDPRAVSLLAASLGGSSRIERELALSGLARTTKGREYLENSVNRLGRDVYLSRRYGTLAGRHANDLRTVSFTRWSSHMLLAFWRAAAFAVRSHRLVLMVLLCATVFQPIAYDVYAMLASVWVASNEIIILLFAPIALPYKLALEALVKQILMLTLLWLVLVAGWMRPPYWVLPTLLFVYFAQKLAWMVARPLVDIATTSGSLRYRLASVRAPTIAGRSMLRKLTQGTPEEREKRFTAMLNDNSKRFEFFNDIEGHFKELPEYYADFALKIGKIDVPTYVARFQESELGLDYLVKRLQDVDLGGKELQVLAYIEARERQRRQEETSPTLAAHVVAGNLGMRQAGPVLRTEPSKRPSAGGHVLLSYCRDNRAEVAQLRKDLLSERIVVWWDDDIEGGQDWQNEISKAIEDARAVILCLSKESAARSRSVMYKEAADAVAAYRERPPGTTFLIPVRLSECEIPPIRIDSTRTLTSLQYVDLFPDERRAEGLAELLRALERAGARER
jgi:hypothetical protein